MLRRDALKTMGIAVLLSPLSTPPKPTPLVQDFVDFARQCKIHNPQLGDIPFHPVACQLRAVNAFNNYNYVILNKARKVGLTTTASVWAKWKTQSQANQIIVVVSKNSQALKCIQNTIKSFPICDKPNGSQIIYTDGNPNNLITPDKIKVLFPNAKNITYIFDEAAFIDNMHDLWKIILLANTPAKVIAYSTPNINTVNWFESYYLWSKFYIGEITVWNAKEVPYGVSVREFHKVEIRHYEAPIS